MEQRPAAADQQDQALVRQYLDGQPDAAGTIVDRYQKKLFNVALRMLDNVQDAEDVTQTVFLNTFMKLRSYDPKYRFFSWIYRIAVNESLNLLKGRKRNVTLEDIAVAPDAGADHEAETSDQVGRALKSLNPDDRAVIVLKHFVFFSYQEIADVLEIPVKTVKSRLFTARERLKLAMRGVEQP